MKSKDEAMIRMEPWVKPNSVFNHSAFNCDACMKIKAEKMKIPLEAMTEYDFVTSQLEMCLKQASAKAKTHQMEWVKAEIVIYERKMQAMIAWLLHQIHQNKERMPEILTEAMNKMHLRLIGKASYYVPPTKSVEGSVREALKDKGI